MMMNNFLIPVIGAERTGKTYFSRETAIKIGDKTGKGVFAYNVGDPNDFSSFTFIDFPDVKKINKKADNMTVFRCVKTGCIYSIKDIGNFILKNKRVASFRVFDLKDEMMLFEYLFKYAGFNIYILDDFRPVLKHGIKKELQQLFFRKYHTGFKLKDTPNGSDMFIVFHGYNQVNPDLYNACTHLVCFETNTPPIKEDFKRMPHLYDLLVTAHNSLASMPDRSYAHIKLKGIKKPEIKYHQNGQTNI